MARLIAYVRPFYVQLINLLTLQWSIFPPETCQQRLGKLLQNIAKVQRLDRTKVRVRVETIAIALELARQ